MYSAKWNQREIGVQEFSQEMKKAFEKSKKMIRPAEEGEDPLESSVG